MLLFLGFSICCLGFQFSRSYQHASPYDLAVDMCVSGIINGYSNLFSKVRKIFLYSSDWLSTSNILKFIVHLNWYEETSSRINDIILIRTRKDIPANKYLRINQDKEMTNFNVNHSYIDTKKEKSNKLIIAF